jgi:lipopolysaccharide/colanic/teichoic acid biosynthesis glycosyltransferase
MNRGGYRTGKRLFDVLLASLGLALSAPLWGVLALAIKLDDGGPVFYRQRRVGRRGCEFVALKFRTMVPEAEKVVGPTYAVAKDARVTRVGKYLRATALDELPQLIQILKGEMSFVGPRPERPEFVARYKEQLPEYEKRFEALPGLTGLAQLYGHYDSSPRAKLRLDLLYVERSSFWLDVKLIFLSFWVSFRGAWETRGKKL